MKKIIYSFLIISLLSFSILPQSAFAVTQDKIKEEIMYDIIVDRFNNGRQAPSEQVDIHDPYTYHGGDIKGITVMLDSLVEHGYTAISLSPIMENAPKGYHGYWVEDFYTVEEEFGTLDDLKELVEEAHEREIKVFLELVTNYVAKSSPLVQEGDKSDWFKENTVKPIPATEWLNEVLVFDQTNPAVQEYIIDVAKFWMKEAEIDGFTLHAAEQATPSFLQKLTEEIKTENPDFYLIATSLQGESLDALCTNEQIDAIVDVAMYQAINEVLTRPDEPVSKLYETWEKSACEHTIHIVDNKNTARFSNNFADEGRNAVTTWTLALTYLYLTPGIPMLYQGSEVPMYGPGYPENQYFVDFISADPELKKVYERLAAARDQFPAFIYGDFEQIAVDEGFSLFKRTLDKETVYVGINNDGHSRVVKIDDIDSDFQLKGLLHDDTIRVNEDGQFTIGMERESAEIFILQPNVGFNWVFIGFVVGVLLAFVVIIILLTKKQKKREQVKE